MEVSTFFNQREIAIDRDSLRLAESGVGSNQHVFFPSHFVLTHHNIALNLNTLNFVVAFSIYLNSTKF